MKNCIPFLLIFLISCSKEVLTPGQLNGRKISSMINHDQLSSISISTNNASFVTYSIDKVKVEGTYLRITQHYNTGGSDSYYYDLNDLERFDEHRITGTGDSNDLTLYFR